MKTNKIKALTSVLIIGVAVSVFYFWYQKHEKEKYIEFVAVADDEAKEYNNEYAYYFFGVNANCELSIGRITMLVPRFSGTFGGVNLEESKPFFLETCRRNNRHLDKTFVQFPEDMIDYNRPENLRYRKLFLNEIEHGFFIAHMKLPENTSQEVVRDINQWSITTVNASKDRKYIFRASELEKSTVKLKGSPYQETLEMAINLLESNGLALPQAYPSGANKNPLKK